MRNWDSTARPETGNFVLNQRFDTGAGRFSGMLLADQRREFGNPFVLPEGDLLEAFAAKRTPSPQTHRSQSQVTLSNKLCERFTRLQTLETGWNGGKSRSMDAGALAMAEQILRVMASRYLRFEEPQVVPKSDGFVQFEWNSFGRLLEVEFKMNLCCLIGEEKGGSDDKFHSVEFGWENTEGVLQAYRWWRDCELIWPF